MGWYRRAQEEEDILGDAVREVVSPPGPAQPVPSHRGARYEVQQNIGGEWGNVWTESDNDGKDLGPMTFATMEEAQASLKEFLEDIEDAVTKGDMAQPYSPDEYRVVPVGKE